jgi:hypothetical protein
MLSRNPRHLIGSAVPRRGMRFNQSFDYSELEGRALASRRVLGYEVMDPIDAHKLYNELSGYCVNLAGKQYSMKGVVAPLSDREADSRFNPKCDTFEIVLAPQTLDSLQRGRPWGASSVLHEWSHLELHAPLSSGPPETPFCVPKRASQTTSSASIRNGRLVRLRALFKCRRAPSNNCKLEQAIHCYRARLRCGISWGRSFNRIFACLRSQRRTVLITMSAAVISY